MGGGKEVLRIDDPSDGRRKGNSQVSAIRFVLVDQSIEEIIVLRRVANVLLTLEVSLLKSEFRITSKSPSLHTRPSLQPAIKTYFMCFRATAIMGKCYFST